MGIGLMGLGHKCYMHVLFVSPERFLNAYFISIIETTPLISLVVVVDEVHCSRSEGLLPPFVSCNFFLWYKGIYDFLSLLLKALECSVRLASVRRSLFANDVQRSNLTAVKELLGSMDLMGSEILLVGCSNLLGLVGDAITSAEANIFSAKHQRRRQELTQTTPDQQLDDEAVYFKVAGDCPKGCVYSLRSLWRKKRRYVDPDASTSQFDEEQLHRPVVIVLYDSYFAVLSPRCPIYKTNLNNTIFLHNDAPANVRLLADAVHSTRCPHARTDTVYPPPPST
ncbi:hypothetical protein Syun_014908 [Stephania yunnanensis]|uniref:Uncharacterized protein n=1 Tax=Stephania yunnanensis TaxID=152371 RepID=A0AAP0P8Y3_9MAGN